ncbi:MAG TPA: hypothetical protein ENK62_03650, partial [Chromatiales bacterium]|nr:hypothetical protein [Chromatiales bacterium]
MDTNIEVEFRRLDLPTQLIPILVLAVAAVSCGPSPDSPEATGGDSPALEAGLFDNTGEKKLAVIMVDFPDAANPETVQEARSVVFTGDTSTRAYYSEVSYGRMSLVGHLDPQGGDVFGPVTIPFPSWPCEWDQWAPVAREMVASEGFDAANYDFAFYVFGGECTGFSRQHWSPPSMVVGGLSRGAQLHEGGHAFGWLHANSYVCLQNDKRVTLSSSGCRIIEYGDLFSLMGSTEEGTASLLPPNNFLRGQFNWY